MVRGISCPFIVDVRLDALITPRTECRRTEGEGSRPQCHDLSDVLADLRRTVVTLGEIVQLRKICKQNKRGMPQAVFARQSLRSLQLL